MDEAIYKTFFELEDKHWWFISRREIVLELVGRFLKKEDNNEILDIGCGTGIILKYLQQFGMVYGLDSSPIAVKYSNMRVNGAVKLGSLTDSVPFSENQFDLVMLLDVIEHIDDDEIALRKAYDLLKEKGIIICTVPAYKFLWSGHDDAQQHKRRYIRSELKTKIINAGFEIKKLSYYNTFLLLPIVLIRLIQNLTSKKEPSLNDYIPPEPLNGLLEFIFSSEKHFLRKMNFPFGVSIVAVAEKGESTFGKPYD